MLGVHILVNSISTAFIYIFFFLKLYFGPAKQYGPHCGKQMNEWHSHEIDHLSQFNNLCFSGSFGEILGLLISSDKVSLSIFGFGLKYLLLIKLSRNYFKK